jgi:hypothetical protein
MNRCKKRTRKDGGGRASVHASPNINTTYEWWKLPTFGEHNTPGIWTHYKWDKREIIKIIINEGH